MEETNNITTIETTTISENKIEEIAYNTSVTAQSTLFLVSFIVVVVVCYILWKSLDNFISY